MKKLLLSLIVAGSLFAEQSVYLDSDFIDSSTTAKKNSIEIFVLKQKIVQLKQQIEGFKSIINGQIDEISQLKQKNNNNLEDIINNLSQRVALLESKSVKVAKKRVIKKKTSKKRKKSNKKLYKDSVFNFIKNRLTKAEKGFKKLYNKNYKKASSAFYLGEIAYNKKRYKRAIGYYQESATLNENASYMGKLLLHTAISLDKKGKKEEAKIFLNAIINNEYPDSSSVTKIAKNYLKKLK